MSTLITKGGQAHPVATAGLVLFFNNDTIVYGMSLLEAGMTKEEAKTALIEGAFDEHLAEAFLNYLDDKGDAENT